MSTLALKWSAEHAIRDTPGLSPGARALGLTITSYMMPDGTVPRHFRRKVTIRGLVQAGVCTRRSFFRRMAELESVGLLIRDHVLFWNQRRGQCVRRVIIKIHPKRCDLHKCQTGAPTTHKKRDRRTISGSDRRSLNVRSERDPANQTKNRALEAFATGGLVSSRFDVAELRYPAHHRFENLCIRCGKHGHPRGACEAA